LSADMAWVVSANMGLGHQRATYPLKDIAHDSILLLGEDEADSNKEGRIWRLFQHSYEFMSRTRNVPVIGPTLFNLLERIQNIASYYPSRDQSGSSMQLSSLYTMIKHGLGHGMCKKLSTRNLPVVTSFFASAIAAEELTDLPVYCIICDADINRVWVSKKPKESRIIYLAPCGHAMRRLRKYGVPDERIFITGFPLPLENIGNRSMSVLKDDLEERLYYLDPSTRFMTVHGEEVKFYLKRNNTKVRHQRPLTISYAVGGAGAQAEIAFDMLRSLAPQIRAGNIAVNLVAGVRYSVYKYFLDIMENLKLNNYKNINIIYQPNTDDYFNDFNKMLHTTDILWTKPSELSFYCGLGIPIIISPSIGPHEVYNHRWLMEIGGGIPQLPPEYCREWISDYLIDGRFAQAAWDGFLYGRTLGTYKIREVLATGKMVREVFPLKR
jgi:hypothetical protein